MPKGGARTRSGPAPDPNALRRDREGEWLILPQDGRKGPVPVWPLSVPSERESDLWVGMWARPQAVEWERHGQEVEVALYVRRLVEAEAPGSAVALSTLVRQLGDSLGLSTPGMRAARWRIGEIGKPEAKVTRRRPSARDRLTLLDGTG